MKLYFEELFIYNHEMNREIIQDFKNIEETPDRIQKLLGHLLLAHKIWLKRITGEERIENPWDDLSVGQFETLNDENLLSTQGLLRSLDIENMIFYSNTRKVEFSNSVKDILFHILTHSAYHRGQIALLFRSLDIDPPITDYIFYRRHPLNDR